MFKTRSGLALIIAFSVLAPVVFLILPVLLGALATEFGYSEGQLGLLASTELVAMALACLFGPLWCSRWNWRKVSLVALVGIILGNIGTGVLLNELSFSNLQALRFIIGFFSGCLMVVLLGYIAHRLDPDRVGALITGAQISAQLFAIAALPFIMGDSGSSVIYYLIAALALPVSLSLKFLPVGPKKSEIKEEKLQSKKSSKVPAIMVLVSLIFFMLSQTALWSFTELLGVDAGLSADVITKAMLFSTALGLLGPVLAFFAQDRWGRFLPLSLAIVLQLVSFVLLSSEELTGLLLFLYLVPFQVGWNIAIPYQVGLMVNIDPSHRLIVLMPTAQTLGLAIGPILAGVFIEGYGYQGLLVLCAASLLIYTVMILPYSRQSTLSR